MYRHFHRYILSQMQVPKKTEIHKTEPSDYVPSLSFFRRARLGVLCALKDSLKIIQAVIFCRHVCKYIPQISIMILCVKSFEINKK